MTHTGSAGEVAIVMAAYNGETYLQEQIDSIRQQTHTDWRLIVRDDGSTDRTPFILRQAALQDQRIQVWRGPEGNLGPSGNFGALLAEVGAANYVFCADQDDIWHAHKVQLSLEGIRRLEGSADVPPPLMVFTDYRVVDADARILQPTSSVTPWARQRGRHDLVPLLGFNYVWGCTTVVNGPMLDAFLPVPAEAQNADYWMALVAASVGGLNFLDEATLDYRKHQSNVTGGAGLSSLRSRLRRLFGADRTKAARESRQHDAQARALQTHLRRRGFGNPKDLAALGAYVDALDVSTPLRLIRQYRAGARQRGMAQEVGHALNVLQARMH